MSTDNEVITKGQADKELSDVSQRYGHFMQVLNYSWRNPQDIIVCRVIFVSMIPYIMNVLELCVCVCVCVFEVHKHTFLQTQLTKGIKKSYELQQIIATVSDLLEYLKQISSFYMHVYTAFCKWIICVELSAAQLYSSTICR